MLNKVLKKNFQQQQRRKKKKSQSGVSTHATMDMEKREGERDCGHMGEDLEN